MHDREPDLDELGARLRGEKPDLSPAAYERVHDRVVDRVPQRRRVSRASIATTLAIALGVLLTGGGASLAISGLASDSTAVSAQYAPTVEGTPPTPITPPPPSDPPVGGQGVTDATPTPTTPSTGDEEDGQDAQGERDDPTLGGDGEAGEDDEAAQAPVQVQVAEGGDELPFTGLAAIPIVLLGAALIVAGALLRRRVA